MNFLSLLAFNFFYFWFQWVQFKWFAESEKDNYILAESSGMDFLELRPETRNLIISDYIFSFPQFIGAGFLLFFNFLVLFYIGERTGLVIPIAILVELFGLFGGSFFGLAYLLYRWYDKDEIIN